MRTKTIFVSIVLTCLALRYLKKPSTMKLGTEGGNILSPPTDPAINDHLPGAELVPVTTIPADSQTVVQKNPEITPIASTKSDLKAIFEKTSARALWWKSFFKRAPKFAVALFVIQMISYPISGWIVMDFGLKPTDPIRRFFTGLYLTNTASLGYFLFENIVSDLSSKKKTTMTENKTTFTKIRDILEKVLEVFIYGMIMLAGLTVFYVSWEADGKVVGIWFAYGAVLAGLLFQYGVKRIFDYESPPILTRHRLELRELIQLEVSVGRQGSGHAGLHELNGPSGLDCGE